MGITGLGTTEEGLTVYDETTDSYWLWDGTKWVQFGMSTISAESGTNVNGGTGAVRLGGPLLEQTTITNGAFNLTIDLNNIGDFQVQDNGVTKFLVQDNGNSTFGGDVYWRDVNTAGTVLALLSDDGNDGRFRIYENGITSVDLDANTQFVFNEQGFDRNFRVESDSNANMLFVDAGTNRVGVGTATLTQTLDVNGNVDVNSGIYYVRDNAGSTYGMGYAVEGGTQLTIFSDNIIQFTESDADIVAVHISVNNRRLGINTNAPSRALDVNGTVRIRGGAPNTGDFLMSQDGSGNATWSNAGYGMVPIGSIIAWHGNIGGGLPALPVGWVQCVGGTIADAASPINGRPIPNLNNGTTSKSGDASRGRFLRGSTVSGLLQTDQSNNFQQYEQDDDDGGPNGVVETIDDDGQWTQYMGTLNSHDRKRFRAAGVETRVTNMSVRWIMRIK